MPAGQGSLVLARVGADLRPTWQSGLQARLYIQSSQVAVYIRLHNVGTGR